MATALTTLANVKEWLQITGTAQDALLTRMIAAHSDAVATFLNRDLGMQNYTHTFDGNGALKIVFPEYPVTAVGSVQVNGVAILPRLTYGQPGYVFTASSLSLVGRRFTHGSQNVTVSYTAGFAVIPPSIRQAVIDWIADRYKSQDRIGITSKSLAGEAISYSQMALPERVEKILKQYSKVAPN